MLATEIKRRSIELPLTCLQDALLASGVKILDDDDVWAYRDQKLAEALAIPMSRWRFFWDSVLGRSVVKGRTTKSHLIQWRSYGVGGCWRGDLVLKDFQAPGVAEPTKIPAEARDIARKISDTGVSATFRVDQLDGDPFLVVEDGVSGEAYFVAVWDERGFIG